MRYSKYLTKMALLIKEDPSITVREIAAKLQFADSKSVYYWLEKGNMGGINEFKRQVLSAQGHPLIPPQIEIEKTTYYLVPLPLLDWNPARKNPVGQWYHLDTDPNPQGLFAVQVGSDQFDPRFSSGDVLVISQADSFEEDAWILLKTRRQFYLGKLINAAFVNPVTLKRYPDSFTPVGTVLSQIRRF